VNQKEKFMKEALKIAEKGTGLVPPNPIVGAIIVKDGKIVGKGWHKKYGEKHAEANAIENAGKKAKGAELYVTLEPCNHYGKQPPCTKLIIKAGIKKVYAAIKDPNKKSKSGGKELQKKGIPIEFGLCADKATEQNEIFIKNMKTKKPFIALKMAMTKNGYITWGNGKRKKISGKKAMEYSQKLRKKYDAILVGVNTIIKDNPRLIYKKNQKYNPARIILDPKARSPPNSKIFKQKGKTIIVCTKKANKEKIKKLEKRNVEILIAKEKKGKINLEWLQKKLYEKGITSIIIEGGKKTALEFLKTKLIDKFYAIISNKKIKTGLKIFKLKNSEMEITEIKKLGKDTLIILKRCLK
jgi:diaminohydroxyphosphoribosylaminopyrimidine deaminase/5-amino-6-(5-phosphoribosylamino)uracil reductase